jgi:hypothetical protein
MTLFIKFGQIALKKLEIKFFAKGKQTKKNGFYSNSFDLISNTCRHLK